MVDNPFAELSLERAIDLRWPLRDIQARRLKMSPVSSEDLRVLTDLGLIELRDEGPVLTQAGTVGDRKIRSSVPSGSSHRNRRECIGRSAHHSFDRAARSGPVSSACRISCRAFLYWFESACMLVSAGMFAASYPHVPKRDATPLTIGPSRESVCHIADIIGIGRGFRMNTARPRK